MEQVNQELFSFISAAPTAFHAVAETAARLKKEGYTELCESETWAVKSGGKYFVTRNGSSLIAFRMPSVAPVGVMIVAAHVDSPCFKVKENGELSDKAYVRLSVEKYGGMLCSTWMDRPLSVAGRLVVGSEQGVETKLVDLRKPVALIPNLAIHMNRNANDNTSYNAAVDMLPLFREAEQGVSFRQLVAEAAGVEAEEILSTDLYLYNPQPGVLWNDYISAPRLDDLQCVYGGLTAFLTSREGESAAVPMLCLFDNEEVGSGTKQGAASTFLSDVLARVCRDDEKRQQMVANSLMLSCDNAHGVHPNHPEVADANHKVFMNKGIVIKYNANQKYTSDGISAALFGLICKEAEVPCQLYANRADMAGGSTLGNISNTQVSLNTVDIGLAQLAMHSSFETAGKADTASLIRALRVFFGKQLESLPGGAYRFVDRS